MLGVSASTITSQASRGYFYNNQTDNWDSLDTWEYLAHTYLSPWGITLSVEESCIRYSWQSVSQMKTIPEEIRCNIEKYFEDSRSSTNASNVVSSFITKIYQQALPGVRFQIEQDPRRRLLHVLSAASSLRDCSKQCLWKVGFLSPPLKNWIFRCWR